MVEMRVLQRIWNDQGEWVDRKEWRITWSRRPIVYRSHWYLSKGMFERVLNACVLEEEVAVMNVTAVCTSYEYTR